MLNKTALMDAVSAMHHSLSRPDKGRCMGCNETKRVRPSWQVVGYEPADQAHPPIAYCLCGECMSSTESRKRAALTIETMAREMAERRGAK